MLNEYVINTVALKRMVQLGDGANSKLMGGASGVPGAKSTRAQTEEHRADELAERRRVHGVNLLLLAVT